MAQAVRTVFGPRALVLVACTIVPTGTWAGDAANAIAERFAAPPPQRAAPARPAAAPAAQRQIQPAQTRPVQTQPAQRAADPDANRLADEQEMLERARAEAAERRQAERAAAAEQDAAETRKVHEASRLDEANRLSEKLRRARLARDARLADQAVKAAEAVQAAPPPAPPVAIADPAPVVLPPPPARTAAADMAGPAHLGRPPVDDLAPQRLLSPMDGARYTVLLVMAPGHRGIRRFDPSADPILCGNAGCYVSMGADSPARFMRGRKALGIGNTFGGRAGACVHALGCIFRGVELDSANGPAFLQPVDLRMVRHDRREAQVVSGDSDCRAETGRLSCSATLAAQDYAMWVVPEHLAAQAGEQGLEAALAGGLGSGGEVERTADAEPRDDARVEPRYARRFERRTFSRSYDRRADQGRRWN